MEPEELRAEFPVLQRLAYLNAGTDGPIPRRAASAATARLECEIVSGRSGKQHHDELEALVEGLRARLAALVGAAAGEIALTRSTTDGVNVVLSGLDLRAGDEVLTSDEEHPGLLAPLAGLVRRMGVELRVAPYRRLEEALTPKTRLIAVSHVSWMTGASARVARLAATGVPVLVDGAQAVGAIPVDVHALGCDFYAASGQKWLCGPNGTGFLFVRTDRIDALGMPRPGYVTIAEHSDPLALVPRSGARRFDTGEPSGPALAAAIVSLELFAGAGWERLFRAAATGAAHLRELLVPTADVVRGGETTLVTFAPRGVSDGMAARGAALRLAGRGVIVRAIPGRPWLRASVGAWRLRPGPRPTRRGSVSRRPRSRSRP